MIVHVNNYSMTNLVFLMACWEPLNGVHTFVTAIMGSFTLRQGSSASAHSCAVSLSSCCYVNQIPAHLWSVKVKSVKVWYFFKSVCMWARACAWACSTYCSLYLSSLPLHLLCLNNSCTRPWVAVWCGCAGHADVNGATRVLQRLHHALLQQS